MSIELDRNGIPQYAGQPEYFNEYEERAWDLYRGRTGEKSKQAATALHLRSGLSGPAYEAVRKLKHDEPIATDEYGESKPDGLTLFLTTLKKQVQDIAPVRSTEIFDKEVSATTTISEDIQAALILRFCGISMKEQAAVLASNKNEYKLAGIEYALRAQYPAVHRQQDRRADRRERSAYAYAASDQDENPSELDHGEEEDYEHGEDDEFDIENYVAENLDELGTEEAEALALVLQSRNKIFNKKKPTRRVTSSFHGRGKTGGKGGRRGGGKGLPSKSPAGRGGSSSSSSAVPGYDDRRRDARRQHIANLKKRTQCSDCHQFGHWQGDDVCPRRSSRKPTSASPAKKPAQNYFALEEYGGNDDDSAPSEVFMALKGEMEHACEHVADDACEKVVRGANKTTRYITCRGCDRHFTLAHRNKGLELWSYYMTVLMGTKWGRLLFRKEFAKRTAMVVDTLMVQGRLPSTYSRRRAAAPAARRLTGKQRLFGRLPARGDGPRAPTPAPASAASSTRPSATGSAPAAPPTPEKRIIKVDLTQGDPEPKPGPELAFLCGIPLHHSIELVEFLDLDGVDQLNPVPYPAEVINFGTHKGRTFQDAASDPSLIWYNKWALDQVLDPEAEEINLHLYRYAYFLYAIVKIARGKFNVAPQQMIDGDKRRPPADNDWMKVNAGGFTIPVQPNIHQPDVISTYECSVMVATTSNAFSAHDNDADIMLAIIDTGCTRTMHGESWRAAFERKLARSTTAVRFPVSIGGKCGEILSCEVPGDCPMLLSRDMLTKLGLSTRLSAEGDVADFANIGVYNLKLHHTKMAEWAALTMPEDHHLEYFPEQFHVGITFIEESSAEPLPSFLDIEIGETTDDECLQTVVDHDYGPDVFAAEAIEWGGKRNLTNKKSKKLENSLEAIAVQDEAVQAVVEKHAPRARLPAGARTWVKQTYAGQMGLTVLMAAMGLSVGVPLDRHTGWDATTRLGRQRCDAEITNEEPYCLVVSHPSSPWGNWSRFNMARCPETERKILAKREANRPILRQVDSSVDSRVRRGFHVALEHPQGSEAFDQPEMSRIRSLLDKGILKKVTFDGCQELNHIVARSIVQQAIVDNATDTDWQFPAEALTTSWTPWAGYPEKLTVDLGKEWMKDFASNAKAHGVQVDLAPLETPHLIGKCERHGGIWKEIWRRTVADSQVTGLGDVEETASIVTQVKYELGRFASEDELLAMHTYVNPDLLPLRSLKGARHYIDIRADTAAASPAPMPRPQRHAAGHGGVVGGALGSAGPGPDVNFDLDEFNTEAEGPPRSYGPGEPGIYSEVKSHRVDPRVSQEAIDKPAPPDDEAIDKPAPLDDEMGVGLERGEKRRGPPLTQLDRAMRDPERLDRGSTKKPRTFQGYVEEESRVMEDALHEVFFTSDYKPDLAVAYEWRRTDYGIKKFITTDMRGPRWSKVLRRITRDIKTGIVIDDIDVRGLALRDARLRWPLPGGITAVETIFVHTDEDVGTNDTVEFAYLTKGAVRSEIRLQDLAPEQRKEFDQAMAKEWRSWTEFQAVEVLSSSQAKELLDRGASPVGTRWVHTDKNAKKRNPKQTYDDIPLAAKSRLVVQGCQGWRESIYEPCLFMLRDSMGKLIGLLCTHVDDLFVTGAGEQFERVMEIIKDKIHLSFQSDAFRYCGKVVEQDSQTFDIKIGQAATVEALEYIALEPHRRRKPNAPLTPEEISALRSGVGSLGWVARQTRPDLAVHASLGAQSMSGPKIRDIVAVNRAIKMAKDDVDFKLVFSSRLDWDSAIVFGCGDSSHGNIDDLTLGEKVKSQCGYIIGMASPDLETDATAIIHPLEWASATIKRVVRGSLAAECNGFLTTAESAEFLKHVIAEISDPGYSSYQFDPFFDGKHLLLLTDANGLVTSLEKDGGQPADKRVRILMAQIRQLLGHDVMKQEREGDDWRIRVRWIDTKLMIADALTKTEAERSFLLERLTEGRWCLAQTEEMLAAKVAAGEARRARKARPGDAEG
ncbi:unnamed protein product [Prorocentrum cordatum]|uniref:Uncharacterized protein n=1 Tax=Prorocentrum cordatum TaxID=2364126 RepID=A0ABN9VCQ6_9DINO|nr:unnamed protein product [Polarella glacialis]